MTDCGQARTADHGDGSTTHPLPQTSQNTRATPTGGTRNAPTYDAFGPRILGGEMMNRINWKDSPHERLFWVSVILIALLSLLISAKQLGGL
jgi:hypothetical protein